MLLLLLGFVSENITTFYVHNTRSWQPELSSHGTTYCLLLDLALEGFVTVLSLVPIGEASIEINDSLKAFAGKIVF